jgi:hypothetical protein
MLALTLSFTGAQAAAPRGPLPDAKAAVLMARRAWINLFPDEAAKAGSEAAWLAGENATLDGDVWEVSPKNPGPDALGSNMVLRLNKKNGAMLGFYQP